MGGDAHQKQLTKEWLTLFVMISVVDDLMDAVKKMMGSTTTIAARVQEMLVLSIMQVCWTNLMIIQEFFCGAFGL